MGRFLINFMSILFGKTSKHLVNEEECARGDLDQIKQIIRVVSYVASIPTFTQQPVVVNGASELPLEIFGESGKHARSAVGMAVLPLNESVEIELTVEVN